MILHVKRRKQMDEFVERKPHEENVGGGGGKSCSQKLENYSYSNYKIIILV